MPILPPVTFAASAAPTPFASDPQLPSQDLIDAALPDHQPAADGPHVGAWTDPFIVQAGGNTAILMWGIMIPAVAVLAYLVIVDMYRKGAPPFSRSLYVCAGRKLLAWWAACTPWIKRSGPLPPGPPGPTAELAGIKVVSASTSGSEPGTGSGSGSGSGTSETSSGGSGELETKDGEKLITREAPVDGQKAGLLGKGGNAPVTKLDGTVVTVEKTIRAPEQYTTNPMLDYMTKGYKAS